MACETFLRLNGQALLADDLELYPVYIDLAAGQLSEPDFAAWLRPRVHPLAPRSVNEPKRAWR